jgi:Rrf2 family protein
VKLSRESSYALAAAAELAKAPPEVFLHARQLAQAAGLPESFVPKILHKLVRHRILCSLQGGKERGYALARPPGEISVRQIVEAIDGPDLFERCVFWSNRCSDSHPCVLHEVWKRTRPVLVEALDRLSLAAVAKLPGRFAQ